MRIFLAGATGRIGNQLVPMLIEAGHEVVGMTRSPGKADALKAQGAEPVVVDVYDAEALAKAVADAKPDLVMHQLTDLPDAADELAEKRENNDRIRTEGTRNLIAAANGARILAQSIAWIDTYDEDHPVHEHERLLLEADAVILRYGMFYGPDTYYPNPDEPPEHPRTTVHEAALRTVGFLDLPGGVVVIVSDD